LTLLLLANPLLTQASATASVTATAPATESASETLSEEAQVKAARLKVDKKCMKCHSRNRNKTMEDGEKLSLHVETETFLDSAHKEVGCSGCHIEIANSKHPSRDPISTARAYSVDQNEICRGCHEHKFSQYEGSIHANLVTDGHATAPLCTDCHSAHAVESMSSYQPVTGMPCKKCHEEVYVAYSQSVHGKARSDGNIIRASHIQAPICSDCHQAHEVAAVSAGDQLQAACLDCHQDASLAHEQWLPNSGLHLEVVSCAACHSPMAERRIDLELFDNAIGAPLEKGQGDQFDQRMKLIDPAGDGLDPMELWTLVRQSSQQGPGVDVTLRGRMKVGSGVNAHQLAIKNQAVRKCESCHQEGASAFQNVTVSVAGPHGRKQYYEADSEVLSSVVSVDSIGGFYAIGGTRIKLLDGLLILALAGGLAIPIGHTLLRKWYLNK
jgi:hypothetical protein